MEAGRDNSSPAGAILMAGLLLLLTVVAHGAEPAPAAQPQNDVPFPESAPAEQAPTTNPEEATEDALRRVQEPFEEQPPDKAGEEPARTRSLRRRLLGAALAGGHAGVLPQHQLSQFPLV